MTNIWRSAWLTAIMAMSAGLAPAPSWAKDKEVRCKDFKDCKKSHGKYPGGQKAHDQCVRGACAHYDESCERAPFRYNDDAPAEVRGKCVPFGPPEEGEAR
jgi:hypothetical protein